MPSRSRASYADWISTLGVGNPQLSKVIADVDLVGRNGADNRIAFARRVAAHRLHVRFAAGVRYRRGERRFWTFPAAENNRDFAAGEFHETSRRIDSDHFD